jgi:hypothetical protein
LKKIALIAIFIGKLPGWMEVFAETCKWNPAVDWLLFSSAPYFPRQKVENLHCHRLTKDQLVQLAKEKIGVKVVLKNAYKICDLKPTYGVLFKEFLKEYAFWGHVDLDILWGDLLQFITEDMLSTQQIISAHEKVLCGHLTLYKNLDSINHLYEQHPQYKEILESENHKGFDEEGMMEIVLKLAKEKKINFCGCRIALDGIISKRWFQYHEYSENEIDQIKYGAGYWEKGKIFHTASNIERGYLHFHAWKKKWKSLSKITLRPERIERIVVSERGFEINYGSFSVRWPGLLGVIFQKALAIKQFLDNSVKYKFRCNVRDYKK